MSYFPLLCVHIRSALVKLIMSGEHGSETEWSEHENHNAKDLEKMKVA